MALRPPPAALARPGIVAVRDGRTDASLLADARAAGRRCGIAIAV